MIKPYVLYIIFGDFTQENFNAVDVDEIKSKHKLDIQYYDQNNLHRVLPFINEDPIASLLSADKPELVQKSRQATAAIVIKGNYQAENKFDLGLINVDVGMVLDKLKAISIVDPLTLRIYSNEDWDQIMVGELSENVIVMMSPEEDQENEPTYWVHTRGMIKFGLPDLSLNHIAESNLELITDGMNLLINDLVLEVQKIGEEYGATSSLELPLGDDTAFMLEGTVAGSEDDPEFNNYHLQLEFVE